jgi:hypothetical protein
MKVIVFTPPANGLLAFCYGGRVTYGVFTGVTTDGGLKIYSPDQEGSHLELNIKDTTLYDQLTPSDYFYLSQKDRDWWKGFLIEVHGEQHQVTGARPSFPTREHLLVEYGNGRSINIKDSQLKFIGHIHNKP